MQRINMNFNSDWQFHKGDLGDIWYKGIADVGFKAVTLPHDWSVHYPFSKTYSSGTGYLCGGVGCYKKSFTAPLEWKDKRIQIHFGGVYNNSMVWCNSNCLGKRPYGYSSFTYDITDFVQFDQPNVISVRVDHKSTSDSRWFTGSGIYRNVTMIITDKIGFCENSIFVTSPKATAKSAAVAVEYRLNCKDSELSAVFEVVNNSGKVVARSESTPKNETTGVAMTVENPQLWSPDSPTMYTLRASVHKGDEIFDSCTVPFGIRTIRFDANTGFYLNEQSMKIKGVCVHHDAGALGAAVPDSVWEHRLNKMKECGCNAIRMSHNPPSEELLKLCDEMGFLVMDEAFDEWEMPKNKWWQGHNVYPPKNDGYYEDFHAWAETDIKDMVKRDRNHPCIILWSIGNEVDYPNDPYVHPLFETVTGNNDANKPMQERIYNKNKPNAEQLARIAKRLTSYVKECDITRPVTAALALPELSNLIGYADALDVVGYNYKEHLYAEDHGKYPSNVIYGSENGDGYEQWKAVKDNDYICGQFLWTGFDYLGEAAGDPVRVSGAGLMNDAGFAKANYLHRQAMWLNEPVISLAIGGEYRGASHWDFAENEMLEVCCYTNCHTVALFLNDNLVCEKDVHEGCLISFSLPFQKGTLKAVGTDSLGKTHTTQLQSTGVPTGLRVEAVTDLRFTHDRIAIVEITLIDSDNLAVLSNQYRPYITVKTDKSAQLIALENGDLCDWDPYTKPSRRTFNGRLVAYIKLEDNRSSASVAITGNGLFASKLRITE